MPKHIIELVIDAEDKEAAVNELRAKFRLGKIIRAAPTNLTLYQITFRRNDNLPVELDSVPAGPKISCEAYYSIAGEDKTAYVWERLSKAEQGVILALFSRLEKELI